MTVDFYDLLSPFYHLIYGDWDASIRNQAGQIDSVIREVWGTGIQTILDASCGIGTQAIGLSKLGYRVVASDISAKAVERARKEAAERGADDIDFMIGDFRSLSHNHHRTYDLVISCDNSVPHLLSDEEIRNVFVEMYRCVAPGGGCLISVRDYDPSESGTKVVPYGIRREGSKRYLVFQVWEYHQRIYDLSMYFIEDHGDSACTAHVMRTKYYAVPVIRLMQLMSEAGFREIRRFDQRFFQPLITGSKPS